MERQPSIVTSTVLAIRLITSIPAGVWGGAVQVPYQGRPILSQLMSRELHGPRPRPSPSIHLVPNEQVITYIAGTSGPVRRGLLMDATKNALASVSPPRDAGVSVGLLAADARFLEDNVHSHSRQIAFHEQFGRAQLAEVAMNKTQLAITLFREIASGRRNYLMKRGALHPADPMVGQIERMVPLIRE